MKRYSSYLGKTLNNRYEVRSLLGEGSVGQVFRVWDTQARTFQALKLIDTQKRKLPLESVLRFKTEAEVLQSFEHPSIVQYVDFFHEGSIYALVMECLDAPTLSEYLRHHSPMPIPHIWKLLESLTEALVYLHEKKKVHHDLKSSNLLFLPCASNTVQIKILDFGLSHLLSVSRNTAIGTLAYMAPEQTGLLHKIIDHRADLYALGVMLYEAATGALPFQNEDPALLMHQHVAQRPVPPIDLRPKLSPVINAIILKLLQKDPEDRYRTTRGLLRDIEKFQRIIAQKKTLNVDMVLGEEDYWDNLPSEFPFIGRSKEMELCRSVLAHVKSTQRASVLIIEGISGIGKTRVLQEFYNELCVQEELCWFYKNLKDEANIPFTFFRKQFQNISRYLKGIPESEQFKTIRRFQELLGRRFSLFLELIPDLKSWVEEDTEEKVSWDKEDYHEVIQETLKMVTQHVSPMIILLDDFHNLDTASYEFLFSAPDSMLELPIFWVVALQKQTLQAEERVHAEEKVQEKVLQFAHLEHLGESHYQELLQKIFSNKLYELPKLLDILHTETGGNPGQLRLLLQQILDAKGVSYEGHDWQLNMEHIQKLLQEREASSGNKEKSCLCSFSAEAKSLLQRGAVFQRAFTVAALNVTLKTSPALETADLSFVFETLDRAVELELLNVNTEQLYSFRDASVRRSLLKENSTELRNNIHQEIALYLESDLLPHNPDVLYDMAHHWGKSGDDETAMRVFFKAAEKTDTGMFQSQQSRFYYDRALGFLKRLPARSVETEFEFELRYRVIRFNAMALDHYDALWNEVLEMDSLLEENRSRKIRLLTLKAYLCNLLGRKDEGIRYGELSLEIAEPEDDPYLSQVYNSLGAVASNKSFEERLKLLKKGLVLAQRYRQMDQASTIMVQVILLCYMGRFSEAEQELQQNLAFLEAENFPMTNQLRFYLNCILKIHQGKFQEVIGLYTEWEQKREQSLYANKGERVEHAFKAWVLGMTGNLEESLNLYEVLLQKGSKLEQQWERSIVLEGRIQTAIHAMKDPETALEYLEEAREQMRLRPDRYMIAMFAIYAAWSKIMLNLQEEAEEELELARSIALELNAPLLTAHLKFVESKFKWHQALKTQASQEAEEVLGDLLDMGVTGYYELYREEIKSWNSRSTTEGGTTTAATSTTQNTEMLQLMEINRQISSTLNVKTLFQSILDGAMKIVGAEQGYVFICEGYCVASAANKNPEMEKRLCQSPVLTRDAHDQEISQEQHRCCPSVLKKVFQSKKGIIARDAQNEWKWKEDAIVKKHALRSILAVPIVHKNEIKGIIYLDNAQIRSVFSVLDQEVVEMFATQVAIALNNAETYTREQQAREQQEATLKIFERFVPRQFTERLVSGGIESLETGMAQQATLSVLFSDIRSFTSLSEGLLPEELFLFLNEYLRHMELPIHDHNGFVDKFIGDAIMALFDQSPQDAVHAGMAMQKALASYNKIRKQRGQIPIRAGIGINTGEVTVGVIGSEKRMDTTVLGDAVNIASRVESLTKYYGCEFMISGETKNALSDLSALQYRYVDTLQVKGRNAPTKLYEIFNQDPPELQELKQGSQAHLQPALEAYQKGHWKEAILLLNDYKNFFPQDSLTQVFQSRCERFLITPPPTWNGVFHIDRK